MSKHPVFTIAVGLGLAASAGLGLANCALNESGNIEATTLGDTSNPAERGSPNQTLLDACGLGDATPAGAVVRRKPYLQQVTTSAAIVGWTSSGADERVVVTTPDGAPVATAIAETETTAVAVPNAEQRWAHLTGLTPATTYCYEITNGTETLIGRTGFRTAPTADSTETIRFLALGDSGGGGSDQYALLRQMAEYPYDLMLHTGDIAYETGKLSEFEENVFDVYAPLFRNLAFFPTPGNHDYETAGAAAYRDVFNLPDMGNERWFSFDWGRIHFAAIDTEVDYATQIAWLDEDLARSPLPWKIVYLHRPPYSSGDHGSDVTLRNLLAPVLERHGVKLVLAGHDHHYERTKPMNGTVYVVTGGGGRGTRNVGSSSFTAFSAEVIHMVTVEVGMDKMVLHAIDATGKEFDSVVIPRT